MGRSYAGILGPLALLVELARGMVHATGVAATVLNATVALAVFSAIGYVVGRLAGWIVEESVLSRLQVELAARNKTVQAPAAEES